ncbi:MAG: hypothetical protein ACXW3P_05680 [Rhodospirillales bacterium]
MKFRPVGEVENALIVFASNYFSALVEVYVIGSPADSFWIFSSRAFLRPDVFRSRFARSRHRSNSVIIAEEPQTLVRG